MEGFALGIAVDVAIAIATALVNHTLSPSQTEALRQVAGRAVDKTVSELCQGDRDLAGHLIGLLRDHLQEEGIRTILLRIAGSEPLTQASWSELIKDDTIDFDTLGVDPERLLQSLIANTASGLEAEVRQSGSPLNSLYSVEMLETIATALSNLPSELAGRSVTANELSRAFQRLSQSFFRSERADHPTVTRPEARKVIEDFMSSTRQFLVITGASGTGKSVVLTKEFERLRTAGRAVLVLRAFGLRLDKIAQDVAAAMAVPPMIVGWHQLFLGPWARSDPGESSRLVIVVDGLDAVPENDRSEVLAELGRLSDAVSRISPKMVKLIISCESSSWPYLKSWLPFTSRLAPGRGDDRTEILEIGDFSSAELDGALLELRVSGLLEANRPQGRSDPHVDSMREVLLHPATFGLYASAQKLGLGFELEDATASDLAEALVYEQLVEAERLCRTNRVALVRFLTELARTAMAQSSTEFRVLYLIVQSSSAFNGLEVDSTDANRSPFAALVDRGILAPLDPVNPLVGFRLRDVATYFLSCYLEAIAADRAQDELQETLRDWIQQARTFPPIVDAVISWTNRLARQDDASKRATLVTLLRVLEPVMDFERRH